MKAMILAAGLGTRMRPLTERLPKPLIEVNGRALIDYAMDNAREAGIDELVVNSHYRARQLADHLSRVRDVHITRIHEDELLETGGGIQHALGLLGDMPFVTMNSDTICLSAPEMSSIGALQSAWDEQKMDICMLLMPTSRAVGYSGAGDFVLDETRTRFRRRLSGEQGEYVFTGMQLIHPRAFEGVPEGAFSMNKIYDRYQSESEGYFERIGFVVHAGDWLHVGDADGLAAAEAYFSHTKSSRVS